MRTASELRAAAIATGRFSLYQGDGASVPWDVFAAMSLPLGASTYAYKLYLDRRWPEAFRLHDWLYTRYGSLISATREEADAALREEIAVGSRVDALVVYSAVRVGGSPFWGDSPTGFPSPWEPPHVVAFPDNAGSNGVNSMAASGEVVQMAVIQELDGQPIVNVLHWRQDESDANPFGAPEINLLCAQFWTDWVTNLAPNLSVALSFLRIEAVSLGASVGYPLGDPDPTSWRCPPNLIGGYTPGAAVPGDLTGDYLPRLTTATASKNTGLAARTRRGSLHLAGLAESSTTGDRFTSGWLTDVNNVLNLVLIGVQTIVSGGVTFNFQPVVFSPTLINRLEAPGFAARGSSFRIISQTLNSKVGTMKHRKIKGGVR